MSLDVKRISVLKTEIPVGIHLLVISDVKLHKKSNGDVILHEDNPAVIVTFTTDIVTMEKEVVELVHQELYWIGSTNYTKLQKIIIQCGLDPAVQINKKEIVGKQVSGLIKEFKTMRGTEEIKSELKLIDTWPSDWTHKLTNNLIEYIQEGF